MPTAPGEAPVNPEILPGHSDRPLRESARLFLREGPDRQLQQPGRAGARTCLSLMLLPSAYACSSCRRFRGFPGSAPSQCCSQSRAGGR